MCITKKLKNLFSRRSVDTTKQKESPQACSSEKDEEYPESFLSKECKEALNKISTSSSELSGALFAFLAQNSLLSWLEEMTKATATIYDKALDAEYLKTFIGGGDHRLFDGGHDIFAAWEKVKNAYPDDSLQQEIVGYVSALWKDITTTKGLPFITVSKDSFDKWVGALDWIPGVDRKYLYDLFSFDALEILSMGLGAVAVLFALKKEDQKKLAEILGSMGIISIISSNPLMGIFVIATAGYAYKRKRMEIDKVTFSKSTAVSTFAAALFAALGLPILFELIIVIVLSALFKTQVLDNKRLHKFIKDIIDKAKQKAQEIYEIVCDIVKCPDKEDAIDKANQKEQKICETVYDIVKRLIFYIRKIIK